MPERPCFGRFHPFPCIAAEAALSGPDNVWIEMEAMTPRQYQKTQHHSRVDCPSSVFRLA